MKLLEKAFEWFLFFKCLFSLPHLPLQLCGCKETLLTLVLKQLKTALCCFRGATHWQRHRAKRQPDTCCRCTLVTSSTIQLSRTLRWGNCVLHCYWLIDVSVVLFLLGLLYNVPPVMYPYLAYFTMFLQSFILTGPTLQCSSNHLFLLGLLYNVPPIIYPFWAYFTMFLQSFILTGPTLQCSSNHLAHHEYGSTT